MDPRCRGHFYREHQIFHSFIVRHRPPTFIAKWISISQAHNRDGELCWLAIKAALLKVNDAFYCIQIKVLKWFIKNSNSILQCRRMVELWLIGSSCLFFFGCFPTLSHYLINQRQRDMRVPLYPHSHLSPNNPNELQQRQEKNMRKV